jgi:hypothetical protein
LVPFATLCLIGFLSEARLAMVQPPPLIVISLESHRPELVNLANVKDVMSLKRHQGASTGEVQPDRGTKRTELLKAYVRWLQSRQVNRKPVRIVG